MSDVLIINGNPKQGSFCKSLAQSYHEGIESKQCSAKLVHIADLAFDVNLQSGYDIAQPLEPDLQYIQKAIKHASHIVIVSPVWWATVPAELKGLLDRVLLPSFAFKYQTGNPFPAKLLKGKTARLIITMDTPIWYYRWIQGEPIVKTLDKPTLGFCGVSLKKINRFGPVNSSTPKQRARWLASIKDAGIDDANRLAKSN